MVKCANCGEEIEEGELVYCDFCFDKLLERIRELELRLAKYEPEVLEEDEDDRDEEEKVVY